MPALDSTALPLVAGEGTELADDELEMVIGGLQRPLLPRGGAVLAR